MSFQSRKLGSQINVFLLVVSYESQFLQEDSRMMLERLGRRTHSAVVGTKEQINRELRRKLAKRTTSVVFRGLALFISILTHEAKRPLKTTCTMESAA